MKNTFVLLTICFLSFFSGACAQVGPYVWDPRVHESSSRLAVANNDAKTEVLLSEQLNEQLARKRAVKQQYISVDDAKQENIDSTGSGGGKPVVFINSSSYNKTFIAKKTSGIDKNVRWMFDLKNKNNPHAEYYKESFLESGIYTAQWVVEGYSTIYPQKGPDTFRVWDRPIFFYEKTGKWYYGFYFLHD